jgi:hypothetical protein
MKSNYKTMAQMNNYISYQPTSPKKRSTRQQLVDQTKSKSKSKSNLPNQNPRRTNQFENF